MFQVELQPLLHVIRGGIGRDPVIHRAGNPGLLHGLQHGDREPQLHQAGVGDHQEPVNALVPDKGGQPLDASGAFDRLRDPIVQKMVPQLHNGLEGSAIDFVQGIHSATLLS